MRDLEPKVTAFCSDCHVMPRPSSSSREEWIAEIDQGFELQEKYGRKDLAVPERDEVIRYFQTLAPKTLEPPDSIADYPPVRLTLQPERVRHPGTRPPRVTDLAWVDLGIKDSNALVYCDIGSGGVMAHWPLAEEAPTVRLATLLQPVHVEPCDLDADGLMDLVAADIGEFDANDTDLGRLVWLRQKPEDETFEKIVLLEGLSRVADVQPGDFDGDGDLDLLVGVFGWRQTGQILLLENVGESADGTLLFVSREIDPRHGAVNTTPIDYDGDGDLDFVALISQGHEVIELFLNDGTASFEKRLIYQAPDPAYGSSGIELVDLDQDGDTDVLYTNGDSFDRGPKPYHSVQWLENTGEFPFHHHPLCVMPGALDATARDFDGDGDLDVVAVALLAEPSKRWLAEMETSSVILLEQTRPGTFEPTEVVGDSYEQLTVEAGDFDQDGHVDFAVGTFMRSAGERPDLTIWWNESE
ncbi:MAG: VCBS repeat-containing protein [Planctomycetota bacterium]